jgi:hypothetical protein
MAFTITKQELTRSTGRVVLKVYIDGAADGTAQLLNVATGDFGTKPSLMAVKGSLNGFNAVLLWDATTDVPIISLEGDKSFHHDFSQYGGIVDNGGAGRTGDILITTTGIATTDSGFIILDVKVGS